MLKNQTIFRLITLAVLTAPFAVSCGNPAKGIKVAPKDGHIHVKESDIEPLLEGMLIESSWTDLANGNQLTYAMKTINTSKRDAKTLFAFHGMGQSPKDFCNYITSDIQALKSAGTISHVICPSFGPSWVIHENDRINTLNRFHSFVQDHYGASKTQKPVLMGFSMGGFNAVKLSGSSDQGSIAFQKVAVGCPAIFSKKISADLVGLADQLPASFFDGFDPKASISIIQNSPYFDSSTHYPELFMIVNTGDTVGKKSVPLSSSINLTLDGIYQGALAFHAQLQHQGQSSQIEEVPGTHCAGIPVNQLIEFLVSE